jgi:hypothetical protein
MHISLYNILFFMLGFCPTQALRGGDIHSTSRILKTQLKILVGP